MKSWALAVYSNERKLVGNLLFEVNDLGEKLIEKNLNKKDASSTEAVLNSESRLLKLQPIDIDFVKHSIRSYPAHSLVATKRGIFIATEETSGDEQMIGKLHSLAQEDQITSAPKEFEGFINMIIAKKDAIVENCGMDPDKYPRLPEEYQALQQMNDGPEFYAKTLGVVIELKDIGNDFLKMKQYSLALTKYAKAMRYLHFGEPEENLNSEYHNKYRLMRMSLGLNTTLGYFKLAEIVSGAAAHQKMLEKSVIWADGIIEKAACPTSIDKETISINVAKAYFRKANAQLALKDEVNAIASLNQALKYAPNDNLIITSLERAKARQQERSRNEKTKYAGFFK